MKILNADQLKAVDDFTIHNKPIASIDLMESAARSCFEWIKEHYDKNNNFLIFCGTGNNGGDGLAIARMLIESGFAVEVFQLTSDQYSADNLENQHRYQRYKPIHLLLNDGLHTDQIKPHTIIIDALFGYGLNRPVEGLSADLILQLNQLQLPIISIDVPSGMFCEDNRKNNLSTIIRATHTLSFEFPKLAFLLPDTGEFVGNLRLLKIGLLEKGVAQQASDYHFITAQDVQQLYKSRKHFSHKGNYGHVLMVGGSLGKMGAITLSARAALRSGAGLVSVHCPRSGVQVVQTSFLEAMVLANPGETYLTSCALPEDFNLGIGPGMGTEPETQKFLGELIATSNSPVVLDADALNILAMNKQWLAQLPKKSILTPHVKEFDRLFGTSDSALDRLFLAKSKSEELDVIIVLKGMHSAVLTPIGEVYFNSTGNPGMATAGSGDVLTGILTGLLASGYNSQEAAILGVYLHGLAGDHAAQINSQEAMMASDIIDSLKQAWLEIAEK